MTTTYTWAIAQLDTAPSEDGLTNVVKTVHWRLNAVDEGYTADCYGSIGLDTPDADAFVAYEDLTQAEVETWLEAKLEADKLREGLAGNIAKQKNPPIITPPLPWATAGLIRARNELGQFVADDPATPVNEAWVATP